MATIRDVAQEAGVALSTVSKYLNGGNVLEENRKKIDRAVKKLKYKVNFHAHAMRSGNSGLVLVMVTQFEDSYCCEIMQTARSILVEKGYIAILSETRGDPRLEKEILNRALEHQVEGIIALHTDLSNPIYEEVYRRNIPLVLIGKTFRKKHAGCVYFNDSDKFAQVFRRLRSLGHSYIGVVGGGVDKARLNSREFAHYLGLLGKAGLMIDDRYIFTDGAAGVDVGMRAIESFVRLPEPPTAIVCMNSDVLAGVRHALNLRGISVPEQVSLCALIRSAERDNIIAQGVDAVMQPLGEATERAVALLLENIDSIAGKRGMSHTAVMLEAEMVAGQTIAQARPKGSAQ